MSRSITIGLLWHSVNSGNLGVGALTVANIRIIRDACAAGGRTPKFVILGFTDPGRAAYVQADDIEFVPINTKAMLPFGAFDRAVRRCDLMIDIGGGDSWTDIYGPKRFAFLWYSKWRAMMLGRPLILAPQTIGPFSKSIESWLAARVMTRAAAVVARDPASFGAARSMAPTARVSEAVDVAFALPSEPWPKVPGKVAVGVNVSGLLFNRGYDGKSSFGMEIDYADYVRKLLARLTARGDVAVKLISHVHSDAMPIDDDVRVARRLAEEFPSVELIPPFADPVEAKSCIAALDFLVAARMHACIAAFSSGVAVMPVAYSRKFSGLFEGVLGYSHGVPVRGVATDMAVDMTMTALDKREELAAQTKAGRDKAATRLADYSSLLVNALGGAAAR